MKNKSLQNRTLGITPKELFLLLHLLPGSIILKMYINPYNHVLVPAQIKKVMGVDSVEGITL
jgi:hypothetical protein